MKRTLLASMLVFMASFPTTAWAANTPELTYPTGTKLATSSAIRAINIGETKLTGPSNTITCSSASLKGKLTKNSGTEVEAEIESASFSGGCSTSTAPAKNGVPWCFRSNPEMTEDEFHIRGGKCGEASRPIRIASFIRTVLFECTYERSSAISGSFATSPEDATITTNEVLFTKAGGAITCPAEFALDTSLTLEKDEASSNQLFIDSGALVTSGGLPLPTESKIKGHGAEVRITLSGGTTLTCSSAEITGTLRKNSGKEMEADIESASFSGTGSEASCTSEFFPLNKWTFNSTTNGVPWCMHSVPKTDELQIRGNNCASSSRPIRIVTETMTTTECLYERSEPLEGTFTTHPEDARLTFTHSTFLRVESSTECPAETTLDSSMTLEREEAGTHPMYID